MMTNLLIDTNVWIYAMDVGSVFHLRAKSILTNPNYVLFISTKNASEFFAVTSKKKISYTKCLSSFNEIKINAKIIFPSENSLIIFERLVKEYQPTGNQVFDIEIVSIMLDNKITHIATFNKKGFVHISEITIIDL